jgi:WD40 repeat protein
LLVTGGEKDSIRLWDPELGIMVSELEGEKIVISTLKITGGGRTLAVAGADGSLFSYAIPAFKKKNAIYPGFRVTSIAEAPDGALVLGGQDGTMAVIEPGSFSIRWRERNHTGIVSPILVSQSGETVVTASEDGSIAETRLADGKVTGRVNSLPGKEITDIAYLTPAIVAAVHEDGTVAHINIGTGKILASFRGSKGWISSVEMLAGGEYVTAGVDGALSFWGVGSNRPLRVLAAHTDVAAGAKMLHSKSRDFLASAGFDGALKLWSPDALQLVASYQHGSAILHFDMIDATN